jgi:hypothetical protein
VPDFDLTPDPRVLQMLGEISLDQWKCVAELIDNSVDAFVEARRRGDAVVDPQVVVSLPTQDRADAAVTIRDNGIGMSIEQLEKAVRAGWSGNNPIDSLGLFGMGFNIATARLGLVTEVYTTRSGDPEWTGLRIDLTELRRTRSYQTPRHARPKADPGIHGTEIRVSRLKPDQRTFFARSANLLKIRRQLAGIYAPLLLSKTDSFALELNGQAIQPRRPCHWNPDRLVQGADGRAVHALEAFDYSLPMRLHCLTCMTTFPVGEHCPTSGPDCKLVEIKRRLHGWVGLQRYMHEEDFGIDLIRNGRVIEAQTKDLFVWTGGERPEREYPIDDQRNRGRFIGQVHIDHCRVSYTKDRFERDDPAWGEMVRLVRGEGPLRPEKARAEGFGPQDAPLYRLFQAFRRSSPQGKAGRWSRILVVKNNERAIEMADLFYRGDPAYQTDEKWFALIEEEDQAQVGQSKPGVGGAAQPPEGFLDPAPPPAIGEPASPNDGRSGGIQLEESPRRQLHELTRIYKHPLLKVEFNVEAYSVESTDPSLPKGTPWLLKMDDPSTRTYLFLVCSDHAVFRSMTMTPADALLSEIAVKTYEFLKETIPASAIYANILSDLRTRYLEDTQLDSKGLIAGATAGLREIALSLSRRAADAHGLFHALPTAVQESIRRKVATSGVDSIHSIVEAGEFLTYAEPDVVRAFVSEHPSVFFDGHFWAQPFQTIDFGSEQITAEARERVLQRYDAYLADAAWLSMQSPRDLDRCDRDEVIRAALSVRLLRPDRDD